MNYLDSLYRLVKACEEAGVPVPVDLYILLNNNGYIV